MLLLQSIAAFWHCVAFAAGGVFVYLSYCALFGIENYSPRWGRIIRTADTQLWVSGILLIATGAFISGSEHYFSNPKLWAKITVIILWVTSTLFLKSHALPCFRAGKRGPMIFSASINLGCWIYGAFLGCAHSLAYGAAAYAWLVSGFIVTILCCTCITFYLERLRGASPVRQP